MITNFILTDYYNYTTIKEYPMTISSKFHFTTFKLYLKAYPSHKAFTLHLVSWIFLSVLYIALPDIPKTSPPSLNII